MIRTKEEFLNEVNTEVQKLRNSGNKLLLGLSEHEILSYGMEGFHPTLIAEVMFGIDED